MIIVLFYMHRFNLFIAYIYQYLANLLIFLFKKILLYCIIHKIISNFFVLLDILTSFSIQFL